MGAWIIGVPVVGVLGAADDVLGVIDWGDIARASELPLDILLHGSQAKSPAG